MKAALFSVCLAALVVGCTTTPPTQPPSAPAASAPPSQPQVAAPAQSAPAKRSQALDPLRDANSLLSKRSVYFDFDEAIIRQADQPLIEAHARYVATHGDAKLTVQGNADERGSREYNLALGQRRAEAVKRAMTLLGARDDQIETVTFGKEKPMCTEHEEACWSRNRRADIVYRGE